MMQSSTTEYITTAADVERLGRRLMRQDAIGVDVEADSMFHFEEKVCLIQIGTKNTCHIIDPLAASDLSGLKPVFAASRIVKIFHGADYDVRCLYRDFGIGIENLFDTELAGRFLGYPATSLEAVLARHFDVALEKKFQKKDWSVRPLPDEMIAYAANDVRYLVMLYEEMAATLDQKGRMQWVNETCRDIANVRPAPQDDDQPLFLKVKGAGRLDPKSLAVLEALLRFRVETARKKDRPPFKILGNGTLLTLAREKPKNLAQLEKADTLSKKQIQMYGTALVRAVNEGLSIPADRQPRYPRKRAPHVPEWVTRRIRQLKTWRQQKAARLEIDPALILNKTAIKQIAEDTPKSREDLDRVADLKDWQKYQFGDELLKI